MTEKELSCVKCRAALLPYNRSGICKRCRRSGAWSCKVCGGTTLHESVCDLCAVALGTMRGAHGDGHEEHPSVAEFVRRGRLPELEDRARRGQPLFVPPFAALGGLE